MSNLSPVALFDLTGQSHADLFTGLDMVWEALDLIKDYVRAHLKPNVAQLRHHGDFITATQVIWQGQALVEGLEINPGDATKGGYVVKHRGQLLPGATVVHAGACLMDDDIELGPGVVVEPGALIKGPTIIGPETEVRQGAYMRGSCLVGRGCVVGHATEMKNAVMLDEAKAGHFAYIGDSILGRSVNLGAGTKLANLKISPWPVRFRVGQDLFQIPRRKIGAILGDGVMTGCNSVTNPGVIMGPGCLVAANQTVAAGYYPSRTFIRPSTRKRR